ncbi:MAG: hypothetical protein L3K00_00465 [Thermoplasmata archaeon]|nr:hypothetical protein [Thermoplasmata archaeon]
MTFDVYDNFVVMYGGCGVTCPLGDTWKFYADTWTQLTPTTSPPARYNAAFSYDLAGDFAFLVGGIGTQGKVLGEMGWAFQVNDWTVGTLTNQFPRTPVPSPRFGASLAYNTTGGYVLLFGGCQFTSFGGCGPLANQADTWEYSNGMWTELCSNCGPSARWDASLVFVLPTSSEGYFLLVGGCPAVSSTCSPAHVLDDVWKFSGTSWVLLTSTPGFGARADASMAFDPSVGAGGGEVVIFGGIGNPPPGGTGVWDNCYRLSLGTGTWSSVTVASGLSGRFGAASTFDTATHDILLFGGEASGGSVDSDTWTFTTGGVWTQVHPTSSPPPLFDESMAYDAFDGYVLLFGGASTGGLLKLANWTFSGSVTWTQIHPAASPGARWGAEMMFDPDAGPNGFTVLFGGSAERNGWVSGTATEAAAGPGLGDTWQYLGEPIPTGTPDWTELSLYG